MAAISVRAPLAPTLSISQAAFSTSSRACSISSRDSAICCCTTPWSASGPPNATREPARSIIRSSARSAMPMARMQWWMRPGPSRACAIMKPSPSTGDQVRRRHPDVVEQHLAVALAVVVAEDLQVADDARRRGCRAGPGSSTAGGAATPLGSVLPIRMKIWQRSPPAPEVHHLRPLMTYSSAVACDAGADVRGVGAGDVRLGHGERRADLAVEQRLAASAPSAPGCRTGAAPPCCRCPARRS